MALGKMTINLKTRIKQFFCHHDAMQRSAFQRGMNRKEGHHYVLYRCRKCNQTTARWEKESEW